MKEFTDEYTDEELTEMRKIALNNSFDMAIEGRSFNSQIDIEDKPEDATVVDDYDHRVQWGL